MAATATSFAVIVPSIHSAHRDALLESKGTSDVSSRAAFAGSEIFIKSNSPLARRNAPQGYGLRVQAAGGTKSIKEGNSGKKSKFQTQFFKPKKTDEEEEEVDPPAKGGFLIPRPATFPGLQLFSRRQLDSTSVFVAGGSGQTGARIVLELLHEGFKVRAGVPDLREAQSLAQIASEYQIISTEEAKRLNVVEFSVDDSELTAKAIGNAGKVVVTIGGGELGPTGKLTAGDALKIFESCQLAKIKNFVLVSEVGGLGALGDGPAGFFAKLVSFLGFFKKKESVSLSDLIDRIVESDVNYTLIQTSASDGVPDAYGATHNVVIGSEGAKLGGKISKLQVASVVANALSNLAASENKVFEVSASMEAPVLPLVELFSSVEIDGRRSVVAEAKAKAEAEENTKLLRSAAEEEAKVAETEAKAASDEAAALEEEARQIAAEEAKAASLAAKAKAQAEAVAASISELEKSIGEVESGSVSASPPSSPKLSLPSFNFGDLSAKVRATVTKETGNGASLLSSIGEKIESQKEQLVVSSTVTESPEPAGKTRRPLKQRSERRKTPPPPPPAAAVAPKPAPPQKEKRGFFAQETAYVDSSDAGDF